MVNPEMLGNSQHKEKKKGLPLSERIKNSIIFVFKGFYSVYSGDLFDEISRGKRKQTEANHSFQRMNEKPIRKDAIKQSKLSIAEIGEIFERNSELIDDDQLYEILGKLKYIRSTFGFNDSLTPTSIMDMFKLVSDYYSVQGDYDGAEARKILYESFRKINL